MWNQLIKSVAFLYVSKKHPEQKIIKNSPIHNSFKSCEINLTKAKDSKSLQKEMEEDTGGQKVIPCSWVSRIKIMRVTILLKVICKCNAIFIKKNPHNILYGSRKKFQIQMDPQNPDSKSNLEQKKHNAGGIIAPDFWYITELS